MLWSRHTNWMKNGRRMIEALTSTCVPCILNQVVRTKKTTSPMLNVIAANRMFSITTGNCLDELQAYDDNSFHSCITDPPYGMGMEHWDHSVPSVEYWQEIYRVLRPGAFCLAFCSPALYHRLAVAVEDAGFLIQDQIMWMTTTKMPKHNRLSLLMNLSW